MMKFYSECSPDEIREQNTMIFVPDWLVFGHKITDNGKSYYVYIVETNSPDWKHYYYDEDGELMLAEDELLNALYEMGFERNLVVFNTPF